MRWRPPTRPLILVALLLLAGALVNVAVAWAIAALRDEPPMLTTVHYPGPDSVADLGEIVVIIDGRESLDVAPSWHDRLEPRRGAVAAIRARPGLWYCEESELHDDKTARLTCALGWPFPSMRAVFNFDKVAGGLSEREALAVPGLLSNHGLFSCSLGYVPIGPIIPGLLYGALFYAGILAVLSLTFFSLRRHIRARRGRCAHCNYDLSGIDGCCPECGAGRPE